MSKTVVYSDKAPEPIGPYSQAISAGNMLFVSGQIAIQKSSGKIITSDHRSGDNSGDVKPERNSESSWDGFQQCRKDHYFLKRHEQFSQGK